LLSGFVTAWIAQSHEYLHAGALCVVNIAMGVFVQTSVWDSMPLWYHIPFLVMLAPGMMMGAHVRVLLASRKAVNGEAAS